MAKFDDVSKAGCIMYLIFLALYIWSWVSNLLQFIDCDFNAPYKEEIIHGIGVFVPAASFFTVWF